MQFTRRDILLGAVYTTFFTVLFSMVSVVTAPPVDTTYTSEVLDAQEEVLVDESGSISVDSAPTSVTASRQKILALRAKLRARALSHTGAAAPWSTSVVVPSVGTADPVSFMAVPESYHPDPQTIDLIYAEMHSSMFRAIVDSITVEVDSTRTEPRGQMRDNEIILSSSIGSPMEALKVFTHEMGHVIDIYRLVPTTLRADPSNRFYNLSWIDYHTKKPDMKITDFVSGYALTNQYEDFAETFAFYVFHNNVFQSRAAESDTLQAKYDFIHSTVFGGRDTFVGTDFSSDTVPSYLWDTTKIDINLKKYLYYIQ